MNPIQLAVFDIAGTTVADAGDVAAAFIKAFRENGLALAEPAAAKVMGYRKREAIRLLLEETGALPPGGDRDLYVENIHDAFIREMIGHYKTAPGIQPIAGAENVFRWLHEKNIRVALNTGFVKAITDTILERLQWNRNGLLDAVVSGDEVLHARPQPDMIQALMRQTGVDQPGQVVKIGDTVADVEEGRNARCGLVVAVTTGAGTRAELEAANPDYLIHSLDELPFLILQRQTSL